MVPIVNISADILYSIWKYIVSQVAKIGFEIAVTRTDGHSSNMTLFNKRILRMLLWISQYQTNRILVAAYSCYDTVHIFKNFYNNCMNKIYFQCPQLVGEASSEHIPSCFSDLEEIYEIERGKPQKN